MDEDENEPPDTTPVFFQGDVEFLRNWAEHPISLDATNAARAKILRLARRIEVYLEREQQRQSPPR